ncbi:hypothetical protein [Azonexus sp. R2A61]|uniref:hypothetical protein n=1 Tax=Azonexus sp. R2A61 TaxID=2744443 RepID=UPI001F3616FF|nr:hypothetical protein [Azonexus sp. R2A61]
MFALVDSAGNAIPLRATEDGKLLVQVSGMEGINVSLGSSVEIANDVGSPIPVSGPLTDAQLRAAAVPVDLAAATVGTGATGVAQSAGGAGLFGWLSSILATLRAALTVQGSTRTCLGRETLAVMTGAVSTLTVPANSVAAFVQADGGTVRITLDGATNPTATVGTRIDDGVIFAVDTPLASVKLIATSAACNVQVSYFNKP